MDKTWELLETYRMCYRQSQLECTKELGMRWVDLARDLRIWSAKTYTNQLSGHSALRVRNGWSRSLRAQVFVDMIVACTHWAYSLGNTFLGYVFSRCLGRTWGQTKLLWTYNLEVLKETWRTRRLRHG
jgi:hypothetical protein